jgi:hypothetical protein
MRTNISHLRLATFFLLPLLATCTAAPERHAGRGEGPGAASEDERLVTVLIDGVLGEKP